MCICDKIVKAMKRFTQQIIIIKYACMRVLVVYAPNSAHDSSSKLYIIETNKCFIINFITKFNEPQRTHLISSLGFHSLPLSRIVRKMKLHLNA